LSACSAQKKALLLGFLASSQIALLPNEVINFENERSLINVVVSEKVKKHSEDLLERYS
jgi:hypothetical protein